MLTKYFIEIDGIKHEIPQRCVKNWDEVKCAYKRADYSGVTRSFTSQFEFVGEVYDMLMALYMRDGFNASAILYLYTITDRWEWEERFAAPIDFSSLTWNNYILKVNCIDNSLAAHIKANKGTKYEFAVGDEIPTATPMSYDRIPMIETLGYQVMGETQEGSSSMKLTIPGGLGKVFRVPTYLVNENILVNGSVNFGDQTDANDSYFIKAEKDVSVTVRGGIALDRVNILRGSNFGISVYKTSGDETTEVLNLCSQSWMIQYFGEYNTPADLPAPTMAAPMQTAFVKSTNTVWEVRPKENPTQDSPWKWEDTGRSFDDFMNDFQERQTVVELKTGDVLWVGADANPGLGTGYNGDYWVYILNQKIEISWGGLGERETIDTIKPKDLCEKILNRISMGKIFVGVDFSDFDSRLANTYLLAAESVRAIAGAKIYSSFTEFVDWMQTVFGYTYYLGTRIKPQFKRLQEYSLIWSMAEKDHLLHTMCPGGHGKQVVIIEGTPYFAVLGDDYNEDGSLNFYTKWDGSSDYNDPETGMARMDTLFYDTYKEGCFYDSEHILHKYEGDINRGICDSQTVHFVHRSELFREDADIRPVPNIREVSYTIETGSIYSAITIGYEKQDYEGFNGRDEFNFNNTYSTGHTVNERKLSLISKYRADCYGIEFAVQKRGQDTTDSTSDKDVFFVLAKKENGNLVPDRSILIQNAISSLVFNGAFSPMSCVRANAGFIGMQAKRLHLEFASSVGNSSIIIGGQAMSDDIEISAPLMTCGRISFTTDEVDEPASDNDLVEIESNGIVYRGFIEEAVFKYAKNESVKYKLIVKDIEL